jgi:hypothetical protein
LSDRIIALPIGLRSTTEVTPLHWAAPQVGASMHSFGTIVHPKKTAPLEPVASHFCIGYRLDDLVELRGLPFPTHLKIDVDGSELDVLAGAGKVLRDDRCRAVQIEVMEPVDSTSTAYRGRVVDYMTSVGFSVSAEHSHQVPTVRDIQFDKPAMAARAR